MSSIKSSAAPKHVSFDPKPPSVIEYERLNPDEYEEQPIHSASLEEKRLHPLPLHQAALNDDRDTIWSLVLRTPDAKAKRELLNQQDSNGDTAAHIAIREEHLNSLSLILSKHTDESIRNKQGDTVRSLFGSFYFPDYKLECHWKHFGWDVHAARQDAKNARIEQLKIYQTNYPASEPVERICHLLETLSEDFKALPPSSSSWFARQNWEKINLSIADVPQLPKTKRRKLAQAGHEYLDEKSARRHKYEFTLPVAMLWVAAADAKTRQMSIETLVDSYAQSYFFNPKDCVQTLKVLSPTRRNACLSALCARYKTGKMEMPEGFFQILDTFKYGGDEGNVFLCRERIKLFATAPMASQEVLTSLKWVHTTDEKFFSTSLPKLQTAFEKAPLPSYHAEHLFAEFVNLLDISEEQTREILLKHLERSKSEHDVAHVFGASNAAKTTLFPEDIFDALTNLFVLNPKNFKRLGVESIAIMLITVIEKLVKQPEWKQLLSSCLWNLKRMQGVHTEALECIAIFMDDFFIFQAVCEAYRILADRYFYGVHQTVNSLGKEKCKELRLTLGEEVSRGAAPSELLKIILTTLKR
jgi:hypothetical protein